jgi:hypothetical protein
MSYRRTSIFEFNSEKDLTKSKADEYLELMEAEKLEHEYFVKMN